MKKIILLIFCFAFLSGIAQQWQWLKKIPYKHDGMLKSAVDSFGNIYMAAEIDSSPWVKTPVIYKLNPNGNIITQHVFTDNFKIDDLKINSQNQLTISGYFYDTLQLGPAQFISNGQEDIFIGTFTTSFQLIWGKAIGGRLYDRGYAVAIDNNDNFFLCGRIADTVNFEGTILNCKSGNSFVARFNAQGMMDWVITDSTGAMYPSGYSYSYANNIAITEDNKLLVTGRLDNLNYFYFNCLSLNIPPLDPYGYNYGYFYAIKIDENGNTFWGNCFKKPKLVDYEFTGFSTSKSLVIENYSFNGDNNSSIKLLDNNGTPYKTINVDSIAHGETSTEQLAVINDRIYVLVNRDMYDSLGRLPDYLCAIINDDLVIVDSVRSTNLLSASLLKNSNNEFYLTGIYTEMLTAGNDTIRTDSTGNYMGQYNYYAYNSFVAKFTLSSTLEIIETSPDLNNFQIFPNPFSETFIIQMRNYKEEAKVTIYDIFGNRLFEKNCRDKASQKINLGGQPKGIYFVEISTDQEKSVKKIVLE